MDKRHAILAVKKNKTNLVFFCEKYIKETLSGQFVCKTTSFRLFFDYNYATQMRHAAFSILPPFSILFEFSVHSASVYLAKMSSDEYSDSEMPYDSSDEEVWEEEEVSGDDHSDGGPGFFRSNSTALPLWDVNCPFPFPSDQGGHDMTNCRPVILSTHEWMNEWKFIYSA